MTVERSRRMAHKVYAGLRKNYGRSGARASRPAIEEMLLGILAKGVSERKAARALNGISRYFVDWNEARVSTACEIASAMGELPEATEKALAMRSALQRVYDLFNEMTLEFLRDKGPAEAARLVEGIPGFPEAAIARATVLTLGHDAFPLTPGVLKVCRRLALLPDGHDGAALAQQVRGLVPKQKMFEFHWLLSEHARNTCRPEEPSCGACGLRSDCRTGRNASAAQRKGKKGSRK